MVFLHVILGDFAVVVLSLLLQEVRGVLFLEECIPTVLLIGKDRFHRADVPSVLAGRRLDLPAFQFFCDGVKGKTADEKPINQPNRGCLFLVYY